MSQSPIRKPKSGSFLPEGIELSLFYYIAKRRINLVFCIFRA